MTTAFGAETKQSPGKERGHWREVLLTRLPFIESDKRERGELTPLYRERRILKFTEIVAEGRVGRPFQESAGGR